MACACKTNQRIKKIVKNYGTGSDKEKKDITFSFLDFMEKVLVGLIMIPLIPLIFIYIVYRGAIRKKSLSTRRILNVTK